MTHLDYFNHYMKEFINNIINSYPEVEEQLLLYYGELLENKNNSDVYLKMFINRINNYYLQIAKRDESMFKKKDVYLLEGVDFCELWKQINDNDNKKAIWKYLQILMIYSRNVIHTEDDAKKILIKVGADGEGSGLNAPDKIKRLNNGLCSKCNMEEDDSEESMGLSNIMDLLSGLSKGDNIINIALTMFGIKGNIENKLKMGIDKLCENYNISEEYKESLYKLKDVVKDVDFNKLKTKFEKWQQKNKTAQTPPSSVDIEIFIKKLKYFIEKLNEKTNANTTNNNNNTQNSTTNMDKMQSFIILLTTDDLYFNEICELTDSLTSIITEKMKEFAEGTLNTTELMNIFLKVVSSFSPVNQDAEGGGSIIPTMDKIKKIQKIFEKNPNMMSELSSIFSDGGIQNVDEIAEQMGLSQAEQNRLKNNTRAQRKREELRAKLEKRKDQTK